MNRRQTPPRYLLPARERPRVSAALAGLLSMLGYGLLAGAAIASGLWWWLG